MIIKFRQPGQVEYQQTMDKVVIIAVQDEDYYIAQKRAAGEVHPADEPFTQDKYL
jgi:hypothetical protein